MALYQQPHTVVYDTPSGLDQVSSLTPTPGTACWVPMKSPYTD